MNSDKKWCITFLSLILCAMAALGAVTIIVDPFFHYHAPLNSLEYPLSNERQRYLNDGILKNFDYDAMIVGSSMTENFKASQLNELFDVNSVKVCYNGTTYYEVKNNIQTAIRHQPDLQMVVLSTDLLRLYDNKDMMRYDLAAYPSYLYDYNAFNDVEYLLNKDVLLDDVYVAIRHTMSGKKTTTFDEYSNISQYCIYSKETVQEGYERLPKQEPNPESMVSEASNVERNITQNIVDLAMQNPHIQFYVFYPPYSIYYWDDMNQRGLINWQFDNLTYATELMLTCENIHLFSFYDLYDVTCNLDNYKDFVHYSPAINEQILDSMSKGEYRLTKDNYKERLEDSRAFYSSYDYEALFK